MMGMVSLPHIAVNLMLAVQALSASAPLIALWDDHEFANNVSLPDQSFLSATLSHHTKPTYDALTVA